MTGTGNSIMQFLTVLLVFVLVLVVTVYTTKWIGRYQKNTFSKKNLEICEAVRISNNKVIAVVRTGKDKYIVVGCGKDEVNLLGELTEDELALSYDEPAETKGQTTAFPETLKKMLNKKEDRS